MGNKEEKTFADLFSSSVTNEEKKETFSELLNNEEKSNTSSTTVTFDNLFDKISDKESEKEPESIFTPKEDKISEEEKSEPTPEINLFMNSSDEEPESTFTSKDDNTLEEEKAEATPETTPETNLFMNSSDEEPESTFIPKEENTLEEEKIEPTPETNPFMESSNEEPESTFTPKEENTLEEEKSEQTPETNPFMNSSDEEPESIFTPKEENKPLEEEKKEQSLVAIPFFEEKKQPIEDITPKSTSPFFEEEKKDEENPFFQNKINLIENQVPNATGGSIDTTKSKHYNVKIVKKKESPLKFILGVLSYALFIWLLLIGVALLIYVLDIKIRAAKGDYSTPTFNAYVVLTGSMLPEIEVSDVVITKKVDAKDLNEGDIITFASADSRFSGTVITHRIIKKNPKTDTEGYTFQTKGDNNNVADSALVPEKNIYGKVILKIPKLGYLQEFLASDGGWIIVILIPCLVVISYDIVKLAKGLKRKKNKNIKVQK